jgi:hypothetical protein
VSPATPPSSGPSTGTGTGPDADWAGYLDALEAAVGVVDGELIDGHTPPDEAIAAIGALRAPSSPLPPRLADRRGLVLALLQDVSGRAQARRDAVGAELLSMPHRRAPARRDSPATLGGTLDIVG